jgi:hypothetical protein
MSERKVKSPRRRRYRVNLIKGTQLYDTNEIARLLGLHRNTVRHWIKEGLRPIDNRRPMLVRGMELKSFLTRRRKAREQKCALGEFYCFRCRAPRAPWEGVVDVAPNTEKIAKLNAICCVCETEMHRTIRCSDIPKFLAVIERQSMGSERLIGSSEPIENCDFEEAKLDVETEPAE